MSTKKAPPERELLTKLMGWGAAALLAFCGWVILPTTTHFIAYEGGELREVDLISVDGGESKMARDRATSFIVVGFVVALLWSSGVGYLNHRSHPRGSGGKRPFGYHLVHSFGAVMVLIFLYLILDVSDVIG